MTKRFLSLLLIAAMVITMLPASVLAAEASDYLEFSGFATDWTNQHSTFTITAKEGVTAMTVNGTAVSETGGTSGGGVIASGGTPYYKLKKLAYDESTGVLTMGLLIGNAVSGSGQYAIKYDKTNWELYDSLNMAAYGASSSPIDVFVGYTPRYDWSLFGYASASDANSKTSACTVMEKLPVSATDKGATHIDAENGVAYMTWYNSNTIDATAEEKPVLSFSLIKKDGADTTLNGNTITEPAISELTYPAESYPSAMILEDSSGQDVTHATSLNNLLYVVDIDGTLYGTGAQAGKLVFSGNTADRLDYTVVVDTKNDGKLEQTFTAKVDTTLPTLTVDAEPAAAVQTYTFNFSASDNESGIKAVTVNGTDITNTTSYTVTENGTYVFKATDNAGNEIEVSRAVTIDTTAPVLTVTGNPTEWTKEDVTLTISVDDETATVTVNGNTAGKTYTVTENGTYTVVATDAAGNKDEEVVQVTKIDKTAPTVSLSEPPAEAVQSADLKITATDTASGVASVTVNGIAVTEVSGNVWTKTVTENGTYNVAVTDNAGNKTEKQWTVNDAIDNVPPTLNITGNPNTWTKENVVLTIASDDAVSFKVNNTEVTESTYTVTVNGDYKFEAWDAVGNYATETISVTKMDKDAPTLTVSDVSTTPAQAYTFEISASDVLSGIEKITVNGTPVDTATYTVTENGEYTFIAYDKAGNTKTETRVVENIDTEPPVLNVEGKVSGWSKTDVVLTITATGADSITVNGEPLTGTAYTATATGDYEIIATDLAGNRTTGTVTLQIDKVKPELTVDAVPDGWIEKGTELSFTASDGASGIKEVTVNGTDITNAGTFALDENKTYTVVATDNAGNTVTVERTVSNIDDKAPTLAVDGIPAEWTTQATLTITALDGETGIDRVEKDGVELDVYQTVTGGIQISYAVTENESFTLVAYDKAGNTSAEYAVSVEKVDADKPELEVSRLPATPVQDYTFTITATDALSGVKSVTVDGNDATEESDGVWNYYIDANGTYVFKVTDNAGNEETKTVEVTTIDNQKPVITITGMPESWTNESVTLQIAIDKEVASLTVNNNDITGQETYAVTENGTYEFVATDAVGNVGRKTVTVEKIDTVKPSLSVSAVPSEWAKSHTFTITAEDNASGVTVTVNNVPVNGTYTVAENGTYEFVATDGAGNTETVTRTVDKIDVTKPSLEVSAAPFDWVTEVTFSVAASDAQSGLKQATVNGAPLNGATYAVTENGTYTFVAEDNLGNTETVVRTVDKIDRTAPEISVTDAPESWTNSYTFGITATDAGAGVKEILVNNALISGTTYEITANGTYTFKAVDNLGNVSAEVVRTVEKLDAEKPALEVSAVPAEWATSHTFTFTATDAASQVKEVTVNGNAVDGTTYTVTANGTYIFKATDHAGNSIEVERVVDKIDTEKPVFADTVKATAASAEAITVSIPAATDASGVTYELYFNNQKVEAYNGEATYTFTGLTIATSYPVKLIAKDAAGNEETIEVNVSTTGLGKMEVVLDLSAAFETVPQNVYLTATVGETTLPVGTDGKVTFENLSAGEYDVTIKGAGFFTIKKTKIAVENDKTATVNVAKTELVAGDSAADGVIDLFDLNAVASNFADSYDGETGLIYDFNRDGKISLSDVMILVENVGKTAAE